MPIPQILKAANLPVEIENYGAQTCAIVDSSTNMNTALADIRSAFSLSVTRKDKFEIALKRQLNHNQLRAAIKNSIWMALR